LAIANLQIDYDTTRPHDGLDRQRNDREAKTKMAMIETRDVKKSYPSGEGLMEILHGVSLIIPAGQCAFIVGPSGSGKSTLLHLIGAMDQPTSGRVVIDGADLTTMTESAKDAFRRDKIGIIFQAFNLVGNLTALENVLVPFLPRGITPELRERATTMLTKVGLGHRLTHRPNKMSGGEQQRVAIARALVKNPQVVLADEPTGQLDSHTGEEIFRILRNLQHELGTTLVVVTHDRRFIQPGDLVLEIEDGLLKG
jgi:putative ABC transport system ATP-binding protein